MSKIVLWDMKCEGGPARVSFFGHQATEAKANDPGRYVSALPAGVEPGPAEQHNQDTAAAAARHGQDELDKLDRDYKAARGHVGPPYVDRADTRAAQAAAKRAREDEVDREVERRRQILLGARW